MSRFRRSLFKGKREGDREEGREMRGVGGREAETGEERHCVCVNCERGTERPQRER